VGGAKDAGALLAEGQTGVALAAIDNVFVPQAWLMEIAKTSGMFTIPKPGASAAEPSDLDGRTHDCRDKKAAQSRMDVVQPLTRLFSSERMLYYVGELLFNHVRFEKTCSSLKARSKTQPDDHRDAGMHRHVQLQSLSVMQTGWGEDSRFQHGLKLDFSSLNHKAVSICDFLDPKDASTKAFEKDRSTPGMRERLRLALDNFQLFLAANSHKDFLSSLTVVTDSLRDNFYMWQQFHNPYLLFRVSLMLENFGDDVRTQKRSEMDPELDLRDGPGCAKLLNLYGVQFVKDAEGLLHGCTSNGHSDFYALDQGQFHEIQHREAASTSAAPAALKRDPAAADLTPDANAEAAKKARQAKLVCSWHVASKLAVKDGSGALVTCPQGAACAYKHVQQLSLMTLKTAQTCTRVKTQDSVLQDNFKEAVAAYTSFKPAGSAFTPKKVATPASRVRT
ncbi:hypothetical protein B484DRAFT_409078, partial [Ochromonadaceae sp. CCMP2298]